ncbi:MAG: LamG-like jellyroll fold domain-containing protein [Boseongicola sp.]
MRYTAILTILAASTALFATSAYAAPVGVFALYQFESADATDTSGNGNNGTVGAGVSFVDDGTRGAVASFTPTAGLSGIDTGVDIDASAMTAMTMGGWFNFAGPTAFSPSMMSHDNGGYDRELSLDSRVGFSGGGATADDTLSAYGGSGIGGGVISSGVVVPMDSWFHAVVSYNGASTSIYYNGLLAFVGADTTLPGSSATNLWLGTNPGFNEDWSGLMDDAFVYDRALSADDIGDIYRDGFAPIPLPAGLPLIFAGLGAIAALRMRKKS